MSRIIIHYFTGTGNTGHAVKILAEKLQSENCSVTVRQVKKGVKPPDEAYDAHIIAFPVLAWAAPVLMKKYVRQMPKAEGVRTAVLAINGAIFINGKLVKGYTGQALEQLECILKKRNYDVFLTDNASYPDNWTQMTNPCSKEDTDAIIPLGDAEVNSFIEKFREGKSELYRCGSFNIAWSWLVSALFGTFGRKILGKFYIADEKCNGCSLCARACPVNTITMKKNRPEWGINCEDCNRCINICPEKAIQVSSAILFLHTVINLGLTIFAIWAIVEYFPDLIQNNRVILIASEVIMIIAATLILLYVSLWPVDALLRMILKNAFIQNFFFKSYTIKFRRYTAPGFRPLDQNGK